MATVPLTPKKEAEQLLASLPESSTLEDIAYSLYLRAKVHRGEAAVNEGRGASHDEAKERLERWLRE